ncbi:MAG: hypothetical protein IJ387_09310 [Thermoguttaceae bacterium]|nr:hypothetical protein [Thermoguttaceae bacterium]
MLRNDASKFRARRSPSSAFQRSNDRTAPDAARRRLIDALAVATFSAAAFCATLDVAPVYAQTLQSRTAETQARDASTARRGVPQRGAVEASQTPLFSGKFARGVSEKFSRDAKPQSQTASTRSAQTRASGIASTQNGSAVRNPGATQRRPFNAPAQNAAANYATSRSNSQRAASSAEALAQPSTSRESAQEALAKVPWNAISPAAREKLAAIAKNPTIYRRLPMAGGYCNPELFDFFLAHPHAVVGLWRQMGYDDVAMEAIGPNLYSIREKTGTVGRAQILYQDDELTLVYCNGKYQGPVVPRSLDGEMFLVLQTRYTEDQTGRSIVVCRLDAFVDLKNPGADHLARTLSGPLGKLADSNFEQTLAFVDSVSQTAEKQPGALSATIAGLSELSPETRRLFAAKTSEVARQAQLRERGVYVDYRLLPKLNSPTPTVARILSRERAGVPNAAALAARSHSATSPTPAPDATTSRAGSAFSRAPLSPSPSTFSNADKPSLAQNSFALSNDAESDYDFEAELDWNDEEPVKVGGARVAQKPVAAPTLVPETSVAKATARPATKYSDALELVAPSATENANDDGTDVYAPPALVSDAADDALVSTDDELESGLPLLLDFENELLEEAENAPLSDAASSVAKPAPLVDFNASNAADAVALPGISSATVSSDDDATADDAEVSDALPVLVFDDAALAAPESETADAPPANEEAPLLLLPPDVPSELPAPSAQSAKTASKTPPKLAFKNALAPNPRGRVVAPLVPNAPKTPRPTTEPTSKPTSVEKSSAPVWRAVVPTPDSNAPQAAARSAPPVVETARVVPDKGGATFRQPNIR